MRYSSNDKKLQNHDQMDRSRMDSFYLEFALSLSLRQQIDLCLFIITWLMMPTPS